MPAGPCVMCGAVNYALSYGGPSICPSCDCGVKVSVPFQPINLGEPFQSLWQKRANHLAKPTDGESMDAYWSKIDAEILNPAKPEQDNSGYN